MQEISTEKTDIVVSVSKGLIGAVPFIGPLMAEVIGHTVPNQRIDRIESFLSVLEEKLKNIEENVLKKEFEKEEVIDILEDGIFQATRALSNERIEYIASIIELGLRDEEFKTIQKKTLLNLLVELNDAEIIVLQSYGINPKIKDIFFDKHKKVLSPPIIITENDLKEIDDKAIFDAQIAHLIRLGLIVPIFESISNGNNVPEFDERTGMIKSESYNITPLGHLLLRSIGLTTWQ